MEGTHPQIPRPVLTYPTTDTLTHFTRRLIGKGQCQYAPWFQAQLHQVRYLIGEHTRLARARTSYHQRGSVVIEHSSQLAFVEFVS